VQIHDTHHPIAVSAYYEDFKEEAMKRAGDFRKNRLPKFFKYFEDSASLRSTLAVAREHARDRLY